MARVNSYTAVFERKVVVIGCKNDWGLGKGVIYTDTVRIRGRSKTLALYGLWQENEDLIRKQMKVVCKQVRKRK